MQIAVVNKSKKLTDAQVALMTEACSYQLTKHVAPNWAMIPVPVTFFTSTAHLTADSRPIAIIDAPDVDGALGYHTEEGGKIWGRVFVNPVLDNGGVPLYDTANPLNISVASVLSHEIIEMFVDPYVNSWADGPTLPQGSEYAYEACDPVESDSYAVTVGASGNRSHVSVSNFTGPHWFDLQCTKTSGYDYLNKLSKPFTMSSGGYMVIRSGPGTETQIFGDSHPQWRRDMKSISGSRVQRILKIK